MRSRSKQEHSFRRVLCVLFVSLMLPVQAGAVRVEFRGNRVIGSDELQRVVGGGTVARPETALRHIQDLYIARGHLFVEIHLDAQPSDSTVVFVIDEGERARFGRISISGTDHISPDKARAMLGVESGEPLATVKLESSIRRLLDVYDRDGYPFAQVWIDSVRLDPTAGSVDVALHVVEGGARQLERVQIEGLTKTREDLAVRLSGLRVGQAYDGADLRAAYLRLRSSDLFEDVAYPEVRLTAQGSGVEAIIGVVETPRSSSFSSAFGYADREDGTDRVLSGMVELNLANIGGSLRDLEIFWRNDGAGRSETRLQFRQRFLFGKRMNLAMRLEQVGLDTLYTWQSLGLDAAFPVGHLLGGLFGLEAAAFGDRNTFSEGDVSRSTRMRVAGGTSYVYGNEVQETLFQIRNRYTFASKNLDRRDGEPGGSVRQDIIEAHMRVSSRLTNAIRFSTEIHGMSLESDELIVPLSEQFYLGGAATLRGYRENQFHSRRIAYSRSELRVGGSPEENGYLFTDVGYILDERLTDSGALISEDLVRVGYGFGLRTRSRAGNIDISFGVGERLSLRQTKVHVILNRRF